MQNRVKLTKRQIKEDKFTSVMLRSRGWFQDNWQFLAIGIFAVILLAVAANFWFDAQANDRQVAATKFARALNDYRGGNDQVASAGLSNIIEEHSNTDVAKQSMFLLGKLNFRMRIFPEAIRNFEQFLKNERTDKLSRAAAQAGIAACHENQGLYAEAAEKYEAAIKEMPDGPLIGDYHFSAMRCYLDLKDGESARIHLNIIEEKFEGSELVNRALRMFGEKYSG